MATLSISTLAGAPPFVAGRLALSMLAIQASIGALNDWVDARRDAVEKPGKPIPSGLATPRDALLLAGLAGVVGIALSAVSGIAAAAIIGFGLVMGYLYDLRLSRTGWSWLPLALALPVVPIHAWLGSNAGLPPGLVILYPATVAAGAALALGNGLVDLERDARTGRPAVAVALGAGRAWVANAVILGSLAALAVFVAPAVPEGSTGGLVPIDVLRALRTWGVALGIAALAIGSLALGAPRPGLRERGWELEAVGVAGIGLGWLAGTAANSAGGGA